MIFPFHKFYFILFHTNEDEKKDHYFKSNVKKSYHCPVVGYYSCRKASWDEDMLCFAVLDFGWAMDERK